MQKFKSINNYEYLGLITLLKKVYPFIEEITCGTSHDNLINLQNTYTENHPNDAFNMLGGFGISEGHDIILEFWDERQDLSNYYWLTFRELKDFDPEEYTPFNCLLKNYNN